MKCFDPLAPLPVSMANRREALQIGGLAALLGLGGMDLRLDAAATGRGGSFGQAKSVIILSLYGGPPHQDTFDMKPDAPQEIRGEFEPIDTSVPGIRICEHLPLLSRLAHRYALVRSITHQDGGHYEALYTCLTGWPCPRRSPSGTPEPTDYPHLGAMMDFVRPAPTATPPFALLGGIHINGIGQDGGFLGSGFNPLLVSQSADDPDFQPPEGLSISSEADDALRFSGRQSLLKSFEKAGSKLKRSRSVQGYETMRHRAMELIADASVPKAFDINSEKDAVRDRYGWFPVGQNLLLARRLAEVGVPVIHVSYDPAAGWDSHSNNFSGLKSRQLPSLDQGLSALIEDLQERGMLDQTLVVAWGEFGRTPKINAKAGRDHWPHCYSALLAGGGVRGGVVHGESDRTASYPSKDPVGPWDIVGTILHCVGIDPSLRIMHPFQGRRIDVCQGREIQEIV
ncbi:DUF1501 domain-containing protein [Lignipirellula cremea]|uniref:DUF1501 domain-containing protein n=1 Tax=Lignipirellula cremea TaxID=2528010 RepID=A0A518DX15_9BACT|nr:DUF1501 domain-containing protein [Lignipirellula cremea]QDU96380.1 hypothetical protein Pla8534_42000 [Lignipirellula cremea]